eukprot:2582794-Alexandrium_andersonii.AAC.1
MRVCACLGRGGWFVSVRALEALLAGPVLEHKTPLGSVLTPRAAVQQLCHPWRGRNPMTLPGRIVGL